MLNSFLFQMMLLAICFAIVCGKTNAASSVALRSLRGDKVQDEVKPSAVNRLLEVHDHSDHGDSLYEWAGIFETGEDSYVWIAQKVDGDYVDPTMKLVALPVSEASEEVLDASLEEGNHAMEETCIVLNHGDTIVPAEDTCYLLTFDDSTWETTFPIDASNADAVVFFGQHLPTEFEEDTHYLKLVSSGEDIEPIAEEAPAESDEEKPWGKAIGASVLVNIITFSGLVFTVPFVATCIKSADKTFVYAVFAAFAAGAILSCAFFLLLFEATHLIAGGWDEETDQIWRWGTAILLGLLLPVMVETFVGSIKPETTANAVEENAKILDETPFDAKSFSEKARLVFAICFGDFMHNLCDGFFIGAAFNGCSSSKAWSIVIGTILHEIPQELSDYLILTGPQVGLSTMVALFINFFTGTSVILGTIIVLANDVSDSTTGLLLAFGGGVYLQIGCVECMPKMVNHALSPMEKMKCVFAFIVGAVLIGLVLLDHEHCVGEGGGHDGHNH